MRLNALRLTGSPEPRPPVLLAVTPPRSGERTLLAVENLLGSIAVPEPFSLELAGDGDGVTLMARCLDQQVVRGQIAAHYPQARIHELPPEDDPLRLAKGEQAWSVTLRSGGPEYVPLRVFRDDDLLDPGSDPFLSLLGALSALGKDERIVARLLLRSLGPDWAEGHQVRAHQRPITEARDTAYTSQVRGHRNDGVAMAALAGAGFAALTGYQWIQAGETWKAVALGTAIALGLAMGGWAWHRWNRSRNRIHDPLLIKEKVSRIAFDAEIQVVAVLPAMKPKQGRRRAQELLDPVVAAYRHYDHPAGARLRTGTVRPVVPDPSAMHPTRGGLFGGASVLGVREVACLWHPPGARDETPLVERSGARVQERSYPASVRPGLLRVHVQPGDRSPRDRSLPGGGRPPHLRALRGQPQLLGRGERTQRRRHLCFLGRALVPDHGEAGAPQRGVHRPHGVSPDEACASACCGGAQAHARG